MEDQDIYHLRAALVHQERICYPIGALVSGAAAALNQHLRLKNSEEFVYESVAGEEGLDDDDF